MPKTRTKMRLSKRVLCLFILLISCNDGDVLTIEFDFDGNLERCNNSTDEFLIYDILESPPEALTLRFPRNSTTEALFTTEIPEATPVGITINGSSVRFNYRTYNIDPTFCSLVTDPNLRITANYEAPSGTVFVSNSVIDSDDDGISNEDEGADPNGDGDFSDSLDTDGDGIYDYIDQDDDNDNVLTRAEDDDEDGDDNPFTNPRDTDSDGIPDYLDEDDDGDMVLTIFEDQNENSNPLDDFDPNSELQNIPRYRDPGSTQSYPESPKIGNQYTRRYLTKFILDNIDLDIIKFELYNFGTYESSEIITSIID